MGNHYMWLGMVSIYSIGFNLAESEFQHYSFVVLFYRHHFGRCHRFLTIVQLGIFDKCCLLLCIVRSSCMLVLVLHRYFHQHARQLVVRKVGIYSMLVDQVGFVLFDYRSTEQLCKHHSEHFLQYLKVVQLGSLHIYYQQHRSFGSSCKLLFVHKCC